MARCFTLNAKLMLIAACVALLHAATAQRAAVKKSNAAMLPAVIERRVEQPTNVEFPNEDSDMLMEPNDFTPITVLRSHEQQFHVPAPPQQFRPIIRPPVAARADASPSDSHSQAAQNFFPSFFREAPPLGHSRPYFAPPDGTPLPKYAQSRVEAPAVAASQRGFDPSLLGSGDFGVIRGGTFYPEEEMPFHPEENSEFNQFYGDASNGHGRPSNEGFIQKYTYPEEQFANFRDFADINTPADSAFSQFVVVYAAKNSTKPTTHPQPKNIFEQLELLDREKALEEKKQRVSKLKAKLSKVKQQKKYKQKTSRKDIDYEPLMALS